MTEKQKMFVKEYLIDLNGTQAAIRAGYSVNAARETASKLLTKANIQVELSKAFAKRSRRTGISQDRVLFELAKIAFASAKDIIDPGTGTVKEGISDDDMSCIQSIKVKRMDSGRYKGKVLETEVRMCDKKQALELLGKHLGMFSDKINMNIELPVVISGNDELED